VNVLDGMTSLYWWQGKIEEGHETVLIGKTKTELVAAVIARVKSLHSYACPCIVSWTIEGANPDYLQWINDETR
jgi:periplasmic divalent cation tolerance protein